jgi:iron-regulated transporter 1
MLRWLDRRTCRPDTPLEDGQNIHARSESIVCDSIANLWSAADPDDSIIACSAVFLGLFLTLRRMDYKTAPASAWVAFSLITIFGSLLGLANIGTSVAVERDWITAISLQQDEATLTRLNTYMRRIDLLCKLLAPLWTSLLTTAASYTFAVAFLMGFAGFTLAFELWWIQVVFNRFPILAETDKLVKRSDMATDQAVTPDPDNEAKRATKKPKDRVITLYKDWREFAQMPVFASSAAISLLYLTVLSFDGNMLAYLKSRQYSDAFLAGQRGVCVVTGLAGTVLMPWLERKVGLIRAGAWSIVCVTLSENPATYKTDVMYIVRKH